MGGRFQSTRGGSGSRGQSSKKAEADAKLKEMKFFPLTATSRPKHSYKKVVEHLELHIMTNGGEYMRDVVKSIKNIKLIDMNQEKPVLKMSTLEDPEQKATQERQFDMDYRIERTTHEKRVILFDANLQWTRATIIQNYVSNEMLEKLKNEDDYDTDLECPIELLKRISSFMDRSSDGQYSVWECWEAQSKLFAIRQGKTESLYNYKERFKRQFEVVGDMMGEDWYKPFTRTTKEYINITDVEEGTKYSDGATERMMAVGLICNSDRSRTEDFVKDLRKNYSRNVNQYPENIGEANNMLNLHLESKKSEAKAPLFTQTSKKGSDTKGKKERACYVCGDKAHVAPRCPDKMRVKSKWKNPDKYKDYSSTTTVNLNQTGSSNGGTENESENASTTASILTDPAITTQLQIPNGRAASLNQVQSNTGSSQMIPTGMVQMTNHQGETRVIPLYQARQYMQVARQSTRNSFGFAQVSRNDYRKTKIENKNEISKNVKSVAREKMKKSPIARAGKIQAHNHVIVSEWIIGELPPVMEDVRMIDNSRDTQTAGESPMERPEAIDTHLNGRDLQGLSSMIILDSGATEHTFCNDQFLWNIEESAHALDLHTNVGSRSITSTGRFGDYDGDIWYDPRGIANVISLSKLTSEGYRVYMDTDDDDAIFVYSDDGDYMRFESRLGLYVYVFMDEEEHDAVLHNTRYIREEVHPTLEQPHFNLYQTLNEPLETVKKNMEGFTKRQVKAAEEARSAMHKFGAPDLATFKMSIRSGLFKNCPITEEAIKHAEQIFGRDISILKGKSTRPKSQKTTNDWVAIPPELIANNTRITLCIDFAHVNNANFLNSIDTAIKFRASTAIPTTSVNHMFNALDAVLRKYNKAGFTVDVIRCDQAFVPIFDEIKDEMGITMDPTNAGDHEPTIERHNRVWKERIRVAHARLPYRAIPRIMTEQLGERRAEQMNFFPAKNGISVHFSPYQIVEHKHIDYNKEGVAEFGAYVQASGGDTNNTMAPRTIDAVYIRPSKNLTGGHIVLDLQTKRLKTRQKVVVVPITTLVIEKVEQWAADEGVHTLKFFNRKGITEPFMDADQIEGVDEYHQGYATEAFDYDYVLDDMDDYNDENLDNRYDDIDDDEEDDLMEDAIENVYDEFEAQTYLDRNNQTIDDHNEETQMEQDVDSEQLNDQETEEEQINNEQYIGSLVEDLEEATPNMMPILEDIPQEEESQQGVIMPANLTIDMHDAQRPIEELLNEPRQTRSRTTFN